MAQKKSPFISSKEASKLTNKTSASIRWVVGNSVKNPSNAAKQALKNVSPSDSGNFSTVIRAQSSVQPGQEKWRVRKDFIQEYYRLTSADGKNKQQGSGYVPAVRKAQPVMEQRSKKDGARLTDDEKIELISKNADNLTKEILSTLLLELDRKEKRVARMEESSREQMKAKDVQIQSLTGIVDRLTNQPLSVPVPQKQEEPVTASQPENSAEVEATLATHHTHRGNTPESQHHASDNSHAHQYHQAIERQQGGGGGAPQPQQQPQEPSNGQYTSQDLALPRGNDQKANYFYYASWGVFALVIVGFVLLILSVTDTI